MPPCGSRGLFVPYFVYREKIERDREGATMDSDDYFGGHGMWLLGCRRMCARMSDSVGGVGARGSPMVSRVILSVRKKEYMRHDIHVSAKSAR